MKTDVLRLVCTYKCNFKCQYCLARDVNPVEGRITKEKLIKCADYTSRCGAQEFSITGGEPSLIDLTEYIKVASDYFGKISVLSNGTSLDVKKIHSYVKLGLTNLSLNVPCLEKNEYISLTKANESDYNHVMNLISEIGNIDGLVPRLNCVLVSGINDSIEYVSRYIDFAKEHKIKQLNFSELIPAQDYAMAKKSPIVEIEKYLVEIRKAIPTFILDWGFRGYISDGMSIGCFQYPLNHRGDNQPKDYYVNLFLLPDGFLRYDFWHNESIIM